VPRSGCAAKFPEGGAGVGFPTCSEPVALAGSIGVGGFGTALGLETLGERWLSTGAMVPRSSGMEITTRCGGRIWAKCGRGTGSGTPGPGTVSCSLAVSCTSEQADRLTTTRPYMDRTEALRIIIVTACSSRRNTQRNLALIAFRSGAVRDLAETCRYGLAQTAACGRILGRPLPGAKNARYSQVRTSECYTSVLHKSVAQGG